MTYQELKAAQAADRTRLAARPLTSAMRKVFSTLNSYNGQPCPSRACGSLVTLNAMVARGYIRLEWGGGTLWVREL